MKLPKWSRPEHNSLEFPNVDPMMGSLIANKYATLYELNTLYTLEDAYNLYEVLAVTRYNEYVAIESASKKGRK